MLRSRSKIGALVAIIISFALACLVNVTTKDATFFGLFYIPLVFAALFFDAWGGVLVSLGAAAVLFLVSDVSFTQMGIEILTMLMMGLVLDRISKKLKDSCDRLEHFSMVDKLTGLHNYGYFIDRIGEEKERADRFGSKLSLIMLDIDFFKPFNDKFGHAKGNELLKKMTKIINEQVRAVDIVARYGGEEFAVILPNTSGEAAEVAERIRRAVEEADFEGEKITISAGVVTYPTDADDELKLIDKVDQALSFSKERGRNRICVYSKDLVSDIKTGECDKDYAGR